MPTNQQKDANIFGSIGKKGGLLYSMGSLTLVWQPV